MKSQLLKSIIYSVIISVAVIRGNSYSQTTVSFNFTGNVQSWTVPPCVTSISVTMAGADGGGTSGGNGAVISGTLAVTPGQVLNIYVGGTGTCNTNSGGGWNGGGTGKAANSGANGSCGGGGATDIRIGGTALANRVMVAAGGGGMGGGTQDAAGGAGGCATGATGINSFGGGGTGGTQTSGGVGGNPWGSGQNGAPGSLGNGGAGATDNCYNNSPGGGGGGGLYGGGSGGADCFSSAPYGGGGGGGGSSLTPAGGTCTQGSNNGPGYVVITYSAGTATALPTNTGPYCVGQTIQLNAGGAGTSYAWTGPNGFSSTAQNPTLPAIIAAAGTYTVTVTNVGCTAIGTTSVIVNNNPIVDAGADQTVCSGANVTLSATGATTYSWNNGVTQGVAFAPIVGSVTYTVTGTTSGCTSTDQVVVTVNPIPTVNAGNDVSICSAGSTTLTATGASTYSWSPGGEAAAAITVSPVSTTTYTVTGTSLGCVASDDITVTVLSLANINAGVDVSICAGQSATLTATGGNQYLWTPGGETTAAIAVAPISTTTYDVTGTDANGCTGSDQVTVTVNPLPVVSAGSDIAICSGTSVTLNGSGAVSYNWNNGVSDGVSFVPNITTTYILTGTDLNGCQNIDQVIVTVNENAVISAGPDVVLCQGESLTLNGSGGTSYSWDNNVVDGVSFTPATSGTYNVTGTNTNGCTNTDQVNVTVNLLPSVDAGTDKTICFGETVVLQATGAVVYTWNNGVQQGVPFTPQVGTVTYTVTGTDSNGCENSDAVFVNAYSLPLINAGADQSICAGESIVLSGTGGVTYSWNNGVTNGVSFIPSSTMTYTLTGTDSNGCDNSDQVNVIVNPLPNLSAGSNIVACENDNIILIASGANTYSWSGGIQNGQSFVPPVGTTIYTVTGTTAQGCIGQDQLSVTVNPAPIVTFTIDQTLGCAPLISTLTNTTANSTNCNWQVTNGFVSNECGLVSFEILQEGCYDVTLTTTVNGCSGSFTASNMVCAEEAPNASIAAVPNTVTTMDSEVQFINNTIGADNYVWDFGDNTSESQEFEPSHVYPTDVEGGYNAVMIASSPLGCVDTAYTFVQVIEELIYYVPNSFTPDGDIFNQTWQPIFTSGFDPYDFTLLIFNRWGEIVWESHDHNQAWDGGFGTGQNYQMCQDGTYTWRIEFKTRINDERKVVIGHVNLIR